MDISTLNAIIDKWQDYNAVYNPLRLMKERRANLGEKMGLRMFDLGQHFNNTLLRDGSTEHLYEAKQTILEVVQAIDDKGVICKVYRILYDSLEMAAAERMASILATGTTSSSEDLKRTKKELDAVLGEMKECKEYISKMKKRNWWQRLWNKDVDLCDINLLKVECKCPNRVAESK